MSYIFFNIYIKHNTHISFINSNKIINVYTYEIKYMLLYYCIKYNKKYFIKHGYAYNITIFL